jgi:hypothetical protein
MPLTVTEPATNKKVLLGQTVDFVGAADPSISRVELKSDDGSIVLPATTLSGGKWRVSSRFNAPGTRRIVVRGFDAVNAEVGHTEIQIVVTVPDLGALVPIPSGINKGVTKALQSTMTSVLGKPGALTADCSAVTNAKVKKLLVTRSVGPFTVEGIKPAVDAVERALARAKEERPEVVKVLGTAGMLCCRRVRRPDGQPPSPNFSNHSWGTAIDLKIKGALDPRGDGMTQFGILLISPFFNEERFFWGAGFKGSSEDAMHFEASNELVLEWQQKGLLG